MISLSAILHTCPNPLFEFTIGVENCGANNTAISTFETGENSPVKINGTILALDGVCVITEYISAASDSIKSLLVNGDHLLISWEEITHNNSRLIDGKLKLEGAKVTKREIQLKPLDNYQNVYIVVSKSFLTKLCKEGEWSINQFFQSHRFNMDFGLKAVFNDLMTSELTGKDRRFLTELKIKELLFLLYTQCQASYMDNVQNIDGTKLSAAKTFLDSNFVNPPTIPQLSRIVALNEFKLKLYFKERFGTTIHGYVTLLRMKQAEKLLNKSFTVSEVAERIGYSSASHFISRFRSLYGKTPKHAVRRRVIK